MATSFKHDFTHEGTAERVNEMSGYLQALQSVFHYVGEITEYNPEKRYIDAAALIEKITATCAELAPMFAAEMYIFTLNKPT